MENFEGSIEVDLFKSSQVDHLPVFCRVTLPALSGFWPETPLLSRTLIDLKHTDQLFLLGHLEMIIELG